jgi:hypothetical protein
MNGATAMAKATKKNKDKWKRAVPPLPPAFRVHPIKQKESLEGQLDLFTGKPYKRAKKGGKPVRKCRKKAT